MATSMTQGPNPIMKSGICGTLSTDITHRKAIVHGQTTADARSKSDSSRDESERQRKAARKTTFCQKFNKLKRNVEDVRLVLRIM